MMRTGTIFLLLTAVVACNQYRGLPEPEADNDWKVRPLQAKPQDLSGDPQRGLEYLIYGDYIGSGIPFEFLEKKLGDFQDTVLAREGKNGRLPYTFNAFSAPNGVEVVSGNCFTCHAGELNGEIVLGLGNSRSDFQDRMTFQARMMNFFVKLKYGKKKPERAAFNDFGHYYKAMAPKVQTDNPGVNPAFRLEEACANFRDPVDLTYRKDAHFRSMKYTLASDVPPLWNLDKKPALYYNGMGRGAFTKLLMQAAVLGIPDSTQARLVHERFHDVIAWAASLQPPAYPQQIDPAMAATGQELFEEHCSKCHGSYGEDEHYPGKLVSLEVVKTDPYYARYFSSASGLADWYNRSWFARSAPQSRLYPSDGYMAPPLDGIWATAPYLHNGSVPDLESLLDSSQRPTYWQRRPGSHSYDYERLGWQYGVPAKGKGQQVYDTTLPGYGNQGHYFGDELSREERRAVIEYLKTL